MKIIVTALAVVGATEIVKSILMGGIRSDRKLHGRWINRLQADVGREIDLYTNRWTKDEKAGNQCQDCHKPMRSFCQDCADIP